jgi:hypothetical protein
MDGHYNYMYVDTATNTVKLSKTPQGENTFDFY